MTPAEAEIPGRVAGTAVFGGKQAAFISVLSSSA